MNQVIQKFENQRTPPPPPPLDCNSVSAGSRQIIPSSRMFIHSDLYLANTNQPVIYSGPGETKDVDRIANCNWWPRQEKQLVLMFVHRWRGGTKWLTSQGGFGRTPRTPPPPPGSAPGIRRETARENDFGGNQSMWLSTTDVAETSPRWNSKNVTWLFVGVWSHDDKRFVNPNVCLID